MARKRKVKEADRLRSNLQRRIKEAEKRGFIFSEEFKDEITGYKLSQLREISKANKLYLKAIYIKNVDDGEVTTGIEGVYTRRKKAYKKLRETREAFPEIFNVGTIERPVLQNAEKVVVSNARELVFSIYSKCTEYHNSGKNYKHISSEVDNAHMLIIRLLDNALNSGGEELETLAQRIQENASELNSALEGIYYSSKPEGVNSNLASVLEILQGSPLTYNEAKEMSDYYDNDYIYDDEEL